MIFGTLDAFVESGSQDLMLGKKVANFEFLKALIEYGSFQEFHFFLPTDSTRLNLQNALSKLGKENEISKRFKLYSLLDLKDKLMANNYEVFHQGDFMTYFPALCCIRNKYAKNKFPITGVTHSLSYRENFLSHFNVLSSPAVAPYDSIICTSSSARQVLEKIFNQINVNSQQQFNIPISYRGKFDYIPLGVDLESFNRTDREECRKRLNLPLDKTILLAVSRFSVYNKMDLYPLLRAFKMVLDSSKEKDILLLLAGADKLNYVPALEDFSNRLGIREFVRFKVNFSDEEKPFFYSAADIFVSPSDNFQETFGLSVIEAMASRLPVVVSDFNGYKDLVQHGIDGFRIPTYWADCTDEISELNTILFKDIYHLYYSQSIVIDVPMMSKFLLDLINNPDLRTKFGESGRRSVEKRFSWKVIIKKYQKTWKSLYDSAQKEKDAKVATKDPFQLRYFDIFDHYVSAQINEDWEIRIGDFGFDIMRQKFLFPVYSDMQNMVCGDLVSHIMKLVKDGFIRVEDIIRLTQKTNVGATKQEIMYQIMWMLKQNFLEVRQQKPRSC